MFGRKKERKKTEQELIVEYMSKQQCVFCSSKRLILFRRYLINNAIFTDGEFSYTPRFCCECGRMQSIPKSNDKIGNSIITETIEDCDKS